MWGRSAPARRAVGMRVRTGRAGAQDYKQDGGRTARRRQRRLTGSPGTLGAAFRPQARPAPPCPALPGAEAMLEVAGVGRAGLAAFPWGAARVRPGTRAGGSGRCREARSADGKPAPLGFGTPGLCPRRFSLLSTCEVLATHGRPEQPA